MYRSLWVQECNYLSICSHNSTLNHRVLYSYFIQVLKFYILGQERRRRHKMECHINMRKALGKHKGGGSIGTCRVEVGISCLCIGRILDAKVVSEVTKDNRLRDKPSNLECVYKDLP